MTTERHAGRFVRQIGHSEFVCGMKVDGMPTRQNAAGGWLVLLVLRPDNENTRMPSTSGTAAGFGEFRQSAELAERPCCAWAEHGRLTPGVARSSRWLHRDDLRACFGLRRAQGSQSGRRSAAGVQVSVYADRNNAPNKSGIPRNRLLGLTLEQSRYCAIFRQK